jgi:exosortase J
MDRPGGAHPDTRFWLCFSALAALGCIGISPALISLWDIWTNDPLRSIGGLIVAASVVLTLRVWRQLDWELCGSWWGLLPLASAFFISLLQVKLSWLLVLGSMHINFIPPKLALYCLGSGLVILFAGLQVWRKAWFPLLLLIFSQPVPMICSHYLDLPLQSLSAHVARSFAVHIGFPPTNPELLHLMFTPDFGMFIAPGCDGLRGAITLAYAALVIGYLKRASALRWVSYVVAALLLGYLLNFLRLCALVLYYRIAVGHPALENWAKQADYAIGGCIILLAALLILRLLPRRGEVSLAGEQSRAMTSQGKLSQTALYRRIAACAAVTLPALLPGALALARYQPSFAADVSNGDITRAQLDALMPRHIGAYSLERQWQETEEGRVWVESAAYARPGGGEAILGVWLPPSRHTMHDSWEVRGEKPQMRRNIGFLTANGSQVLFDSAFYSDGIIDSFAGNAFCSPSSCEVAPPAQRLRIEFVVDPVDFVTRGTRAVPIFFRVAMPHSGAPDARVQEDLTLEARQFLSGVDFLALSRKFQ